jgi:hypothetical protein
MHLWAQINGTFRLTMQLRVILITSDNHSQAGASMVRFVASSALAAIFCASLARDGVTELRLGPMPRAGLAVTQIDAHYGNAADDTDFLFRLGMLEGHLMVGHELMRANQAALALPHFGHPVRELYDDIAGYLNQKGFTPFDKQLAALEAAVAAAPGSTDTETRFQGAIATVRKARELAPADLRASLPQMIRVCADTIDAASGEYGGSLERGRVAALVEYHDSRGFLEFVAQQLAELKTAHREPQEQAQLERFAAALARAEWIVGDLLPAPTPRASVATYRAIAAEARDIARQ